MTKNSATKYSQTGKKLLIHRFLPYLFIFHPLARTLDLLDARWILASTRENSIKTSVKKKRTSVKRLSFLQSKKCLRSIIFSILGRRLQAMTITSHSPHTQAQRTIIHLEINILHSEGLEEDWLKDNINCCDFCSSRYFGCKMAGGESLELKWLAQWEAVCGIEQQPLCGKTMAYRCKRFLKEGWLVIGWYRR